MEHILTEPDRIKASLLGFAIGDALGATTEFMHPDTIRDEIGVHTEITGGGWLDLEAGQITDDTQMTLCVARSLVEHGGFNLKDIACRFAEWHDSDPPDIGSTCRAGIGHFKRTGELIAPYDVRGAGNGGVMRALPLIISFHNDHELMLNTVLSQSRLTHNNKESDLGCRCYAELVAAALKGASRNELRVIADKYPLFSPDQFDGNSGGYIVETMRTVLHHFFKADTLEECLVGVVNCGQDADTTGALAGGLAGAYWGQEALPSRWLKKIDPEVHDELTALAGQLER